MIELLNQHRDEIAALCRKHGVRKLELFGSAARDDFDPAISDVDFFYEFDANPSHLADRFFSLMEDLIPSPKSDPGDVRESRGP